MPDTPLHRIRFPDGEVEYRTSSTGLPIGAIFTSRGVEWRVVKHVRYSVIVERHTDAERPYPPARPETLPGPLETFTIENILVA